MTRLVVSKSKWESAESHKSTSVQCSKTSQHPWVILFSHNDCRQTVHKGDYFISDAKILLGEALNDEPKHAWEKPEAKKGGENDK